MSAEFSTFGANSVLDGTGIPATLYLKAHLGNPGAAGSSTPGPAGAAGTANAAAETTRKAFTRSAASAGATSNPALLQWTSAAATENWTHWTAWDAATAGNCWMVGDLSATVNVAATDTVEIAIGDLDLAVTIWT